MLDLPKDSKKADILQDAKDLSFPNGRSKFGRFEACSHDILNFQEEAVLDEDITGGTAHGAKNGSVEVLPVHQEPAR